jgi:HD-GYP domain-containing protein (c-di-GMP phosphodiesterase class II)
VDPEGSHLEQLELAERQLLVFAREINHLYQAERARAAELERALDRLRGSYLDMIKTLAFVVGAKDPSTRAHLQRTHDYAVVLAEAVDPELAADEQLRYGFLLHDVGKVGIPEAVLNKPGPLDAREWEVMRAHPLLGVQMVAGIKSLGSAVEVVRCHHERWDGKGYPSGLAGDDIPAGARVFSVADAFDAMTSDRPYRKAIPFDRACQEIADGAGSQFDPAVVEAFTAIVPDLPGLHAALHDGAVDSLARAIPSSATLPLRGAEPGAGPVQAARAREKGARAPDAAGRS